jgi:hypothetical protein
MMYVVVLLILVVDIMSFQVKEKISKILLSVLTNTNEQPTNISLALCGATVLIFEELHFPNTR